MRAALCPTTWINASRRSAWTASVAYPAVQAERREALIRLVGQSAARISASLGYLGPAEPGMGSARVA